MEVKEFQVGFSDFVIDFRSEFPMKVPEELRHFLCEGGTPTDSYDLRIMKEQPQSSGERLYCNHGITAYAESDGTLLLYGDENRDEIIFACRVRQNGRHTIYVRRDAAEHMAFGSRLGGIMNGEELLLRHDALVLHSSLVSYEGQGILFSGPSGMGKSTQADLWKQTFGAEILNGDRAVIRRTDEGFRAGGSPWCGSSGIYSRKSVPVKAIVLLRQGKENRIQLAEPRIAFREIYSQCIVHDWDRCFVDRLCDLIAELVRKVPVYVLSCLPEPSAPILTEKIVFRGEKG